MPPTEGPALGPPPQDYRPSRGHEAADHSMRNLALAAAAIAAVVAGGVWMLSGHHQPAAIPVIEPDATPLRIKPANPGGMQVAGADDALPADPHAEENDRLAPPPEAPAPQELRAESHAAAAPALAPPPPAGPPPAAPSPAVPSPAAVSPAAPPPHAVAPAAVPPPADLAPIPLPTASERHGGSFVQLAALDSEAAAHAAWAQLTQRMPEVLGGRTPKIERTVHDGHVFWRLRAGPFADIAAATTFAPAFAATAPPALLPASERMAPRAAVVGIAGTALSGEERALFAATPPAGVIVFARNVAAPAQLRALTTELRAVLGPLAVLMVDQEGGRVARLRPPHWVAHPSAAALGRVHARDAAAGLRAAWITGALIGLDCAAAGLDVVCAPVLDLQVAGAHDIIGDRAFSADPDAVAALGGALAAGARAAGVQPVAKHIPGHGRATADSHLELPRLEHGSAADLAPFIANAAIGWAMTAHIVYAAWDPMRPATLSPAVIAGVVRGTCGFGGVLISDDVSMRALTGAPADLACRAIDAGCDLALHCTGVLGETAAVLAACPALSEAALGRLRAARAAAGAIPLDRVALLDERAALIAGDG